MNKNKLTKIVVTFALTISFGLISSCGNKNDIANTDDSELDPKHLLSTDQVIQNALKGLTCVKPNDRQIASVQDGLVKKDQFLSLCLRQTQNSNWCKQLVRPNPDSSAVFDCTYGSSLDHILIHPEEKTWANAISAVQIIQDLEKLGIKIYNIYNWWRPEPYNKNVGGSATRHPFGTSVDVRFSTKQDQEKAHTMLCKMRKAGRLRALGYYSGTALHLGVGDANANTWGKSCP
jgi:hypothetical protein